VKPGNEVAFIEARGGFTLWTIRIGRGYNLRSWFRRLRMLMDSSHSDRSRTGDPYVMEEHPEFRHASAAFRELCDEIQPHTMQFVSSAG
jgi:hypothetical protein